MIIISVSIIHTIDQPLCVTTTWKKEKKKKEAERTSKVVFQRFFRFPITPSILLALFYILGMLIARSRVSFFFVSCR